MSMHVFVSSLHKVIDMFHSLHRLMHFILYLPFISDSWGRQTKNCRNMDHRPSRSRNI